jgi:hypothetical protein
MATDPNWLLSTLSQSAAAVVAIVGGFLVSRVVSLSAERNGLTRRRSEVLRRRADAEAIRISNQAVMSREDAQAWMSFRWSALLASHGDLAAADIGAADLRRLDEADEEFRRVVDVELTALSSAFSLLLGMHEGGKQIFAPWHDYYHDHKAELSAEIRTMRDQRRLHAAYWQIHTELKAQRPASFPAMPEVGLPGALYSGERSQLYPQAKDVLAATAEDLRHINADLAAIDHELDVLGRPANLLAGVGVLVGFAIVGICWPLWLMSKEPATLSPALRTGLFAGFCVGLGSVVAYISLSVLALRRSPH